MAAPPLSKGTAQLLDAMMAESKLTAVQRRKLKQTLSASGALPAQLPPDYIPVDPGPKRVQKEIKGRVPCSPSRRSTIKVKDAILQSNPYEVERFRPTRGRYRTTDQKERLQDMFEDASKPAAQQRRTAGGIKKKVAPPPPKPAPPPERDRFDELVDEIREREQFLVDMRELGAARDHEAPVRFQIAQRVAEMERIDRERTAAAGIKCLDPGA